MNDFYRLAGDGIHYPFIPVQHREDDYPEDGFATLWSMQERHFWYRGRHRFLLHAVDQYCHAQRAMAAVDLGGGVGGWVRYLYQRRPGLFNPLALADSSQIALLKAGVVLPVGVERYHIDLMNLGWRDHWDVAFMLDVIEHLPDDIEALCQVRAALKPGGFLFVTTPALKQFWSYNDELAHHQRRYTRADLVRLAEKTALQLCDARYFMFLLSPLYWLTRTGPAISRLDEAQKRELIRKTHEVPTTPLNLALSTVFALETPLGHWLPFPWGTSVLGVFRK